MVTSARYCCHSFLAISSRNRKSPFPPSSSFLLRQIKPSTFRKDHKRRFLGLPSPPLPVLPSPPISTPSFFFSVFCRPRGEEKSQRKRKGEGGRDFFLLLRPSPFSSPVPHTTYSSTQPVPASFFSSLQPQLPPPRSFTFSPLRPLPRDANVMAL